MDQEQEVDHWVEPRRIKRAMVEKSFGPDFITFMLESEPQSFKEAVNSIEESQWKEAINSEVESYMRISRSSYKKQITRL